MNMAILLYNSSICWVDLNSEWVVLNKFISCRQASGQRVSNAVFIIVYWDYK